MTTRIELRTTSQPVQIPESGIQLRAPGLDGSITWNGARGATETRAETTELPLLNEAIAEADLQDRHTLEVNAPTPTRPAGYERITADEVAPDELEINVPAPADESQFVIYTDEDGVTTIHFPNPPAVAPQARVARAEGEVHTFRIPLRQPVGTPGSESQSRLVGGLARKLIKVVAHKLFKPFEGKAVFLAAELWENKCRAEQGFHSGSSAQQLLQPHSIPYKDWKSLSGNKTLLFIHGTTSSTAGAFQGLQKFPAAIHELYKRYQGRVLGFNHHTLTKCVAQNVVDLYASLGPGDYSFDIISHSRGGLLARSLLELDAIKMGQLIKKTWSLPAGVRVNVNKIVFVGTPNAATDLADPKDIPVVLSRLAAIIGLLKDAPPVLALGAVLSIASGVAQAILEGVSDFAAEGLKSLPGLVDMSPGCAFLDDLANADPSRYWGIQAQYRADGGLLAVLENGGVDLVFHGKPNDLVVPTDGVSQTTGFKLSQLTPPHVWVFKPQDGVNHVNYFYQPATWQSILSFLN